jgi:hypothetical protein
VKAFKLPDLGKFFQQETGKNPNGIHSIACIENKVIIATPHIQQGTVIVTTLVKNKPSTHNNSIVINAHKTSISQLLLSSNG